jgi:hypothetical protein
MLIGVGNLLTLLGLGIFAAYLSIRRGVKSPVPLWVILLFAPMLLVGWEILGRRPLPQFLFISIYLICTWLYFRLSRSEMSSLDVAYEEVLSAAIATDISIKPSLPSPSTHLTKSEEAMLKNCFPLSLFYLQSIKYYNQAIICQGQLRYKPKPRSGEVATAVAYKSINRNVREKFGDRFLVLLQERDTEPPETDTETDTDNDNNKYLYYFALISSASLERSSDRSSRSSSALPVILLLITLLTLLWTGTHSTISVATEPFDLTKMLADAMTLMQDGITYLFGAAAIFACRELARDRVAKRHKLEISPPHFIPFIGSFGCLGGLTWLRSVVPHRRALFDLAIAPSAAGLILSLCLFTLGVVQSDPVAQAATPSNFLTAYLVPFNLKSSILMATVAQVVTWGRFSTGLIDLHPLGLAGCLGIAISAISLIPLGTLEGGHLIHAMFGIRKVATIGKVSRLLLLTISLLARSWLCAFVLVLFLVDSYKPPALDEATELDNWHDALGFLFLALMLLVISPVPKFCLPFLGIN